MKLTEGFITQQVDDAQIMLATGDAFNVFSGLVRSNETAAFIIDSLKEETSADAIVDAMEERYDAPREVIAQDVARILDQLREIGALQE